MPEQAEIVARLLKNCLKGKASGPVGIAFKSGSASLARLMLEPHSFVVFGEAFHSMFRVKKKCIIDNGGTLRNDIAFLETKFSSLPIAKHSFEALVLQGGLPKCGKSHLDSLKILRDLIKPGGVLLWPQPVDDGLLGFFAKVFYPNKKSNLGAVKRYQLCKLLMEAGFSEVGQIPTVGKTIPWVIAKATAPSRPWEQY